MVRLSSVGARGVRTGALVAVGAMVVTLFQAVPAGAVDDRRYALDAGAGAPGQAAAASAVSARTGNLQTRPQGYPVASSAPAQRLQRANVRQSLDNGRIRATVVLRAVPTAATNSTVLVGFGKNNNGVCDLVNGAPHVETTKVLNPGNGFSRNGRTVTMNKALDEATYMDWNCAVVALRPSPTADNDYDALVGALTDIPAKPKLRIPSVKVLNKDRKRINVVRNTWTPVTVTVRNNGRVDATGVKVRSGNRHFRVRKQHVGKVWSGGGRTTSRIEVRRVTQAKRAPLRLVAFGNGVQGATKRATTRVAKPRKPVAGRYRAKNGKISFRVNKAGRIVNFRARGVQMTCRPPLGYPTFQTATLNYPRKPNVRANGLVDAYMRYEQGNTWYNAGLQMRVRGRNITEGRFTYTTANWCSVTENFNPRRL